MGSFTIHPLAKIRYDRTTAFLAKTLTPPARILDLGTRNAYTEIMENQGFTCFNTSGDLNSDPGLVANFEVDAVTAFEIFEHLLNPYTVLKHLPAKRLFVTVPLRLWFDAAYRNPADRWDQHFHEFEDWQFDWLLEETGWKIVRKEKWNGPVNKIGFRPLLRKLTPRYYALEAVRV